MDKTTQEPGEARKLRGQNRVAFLAHLPKIRPEIIEEGWPLKGVYNRYAETLDMSYNQFVRYVNRYILQKDAPNQGMSVPQTIVKEKAPPEPPVQKAPEKPTSGFKQFVPGPTDPDPKELW